MLVAVVLAAPSVAVMLHGDELAIVGIDDAIAGWSRLVAEARWADPASGFSLPERRWMPGRAGWWGASIWTALAAAAVTLAAAQRIDRTIAGPRLGRAWWQPTGSRPRSWARPRDLQRLTVPKPVPVPGRLTLGTFGWPPRLLACEEELNLALIAPTRSGKTSRFVIPWLLDHPGPAVVLSTKHDVLEVTRAHRERLGRVWVWDPFGLGERSAGWTPLSGCDTWQGALRRAQWLADADVGEAGGGSEAAAFWRGEAAKLLAPLLHAAAVEDRSMAEVLLWLDRQDENEPLEVLRAAGASAATAQLQAVLGLDPRNRGTTYMSAGALLAAYRFPAVQASDRADVTPDRLLDGGANTVYIVASEHDQQLLAALVVAMLSELLERAAQRHQTSDARLLLLMDETANIAPIGALPKYLALVLGAGVRVVTVWQDLAQLRQRYRHAAGSILSNSQAKVFLGPITDNDTRRYVSDLLGDEEVETRTRTRGSGARGASVSMGRTWRPRGSAQALQQFGPGRALVVHTDLPAAVVRTRAWWQDRRLSNLVRCSEESRRISK